jgi:hypothetical protein
MNRNDSSTAELLFAIGGCLVDPKYGNADYVGAALYFRQASALGDGVSRFNLFVMHNNGDYVCEGRKKRKDVKELNDGMVRLRLVIKESCGLCAFCSSDSVVIGTHSQSRFLFMNDWKIWNQSIEVLM